MEKITEDDMRTYVELCKNLSFDTIENIRSDILSNRDSESDVRICHKYGITRDDVSAIRKINDVDKLKHVYDRYHEMKGHKEMRGGNWLTDKAKALVKQGTEQAKAQGKEALEKAKQQAKSAATSAVTHAKEAAAATINNATKTATASAMSVSTINEIKNSLLKELVPIIRQIVIDELKNNSNSEKVCTKEACDKQQCDCGK